MPADKFCLDDFRDVGKTLVVQDAVDVLPVFDQLFRPKFASVFVFVLQFLQPQPHTTNVDSVKTFAQQLALE